MPSGQPGAIWIQTAGGGLAANSLVVQRSGVLVCPMKHYHLFPDWACSWFVCRNEVSALMGWVRVSTMGWGNGCARGRRAYVVNPCETQRMAAGPAQHVAHTMKGRVVDIVNAEILLERWVWLHVVFMEYHRRCPMKNYYVFVLFRHATMNCLGSTLRCQCPHIISSPFNSREINRFGASVMCVHCRCRHATFGKDSVCAQLSLAMSFLYRPRP